MTVSTSTNNVVYRGNGATTQFAVPFKVLDEDHLRVRRRVFATGVIDYTYVGTDYSYVGIGASSGTLTLAGTALDDDYELMIERIVSYTQDLDIVNAGGFYPETVEEQLDLITMGVQQIADLAGRGAIVPVGEAGFELTKISDRAGKFFGFDGAGQFIASSGTGADAGLRTDLAATTGAALVAYGNTTVDRVLREQALSLMRHIPYNLQAAIQAGTSATPVHVYVQEWLDAMEDELKPGFMPYGKYIVSGTSTWQMAGDVQGPVIFGEGSLSSLFVPVDLDNGAVLFLDGSSLNPYHHAINMHLFDFGIDSLYDGGGSPLSTGTLTRGIEMVGMIFGVIERVSIQHLTSHGYFVPRRNDINANPDYYTSQIILKSCHVERCAGWAFYSNASFGLNLKLEDPYFVVNAGGGLLTGGQSLLVERGTIAFNGSQAALDLYTADPATGSELGGGGVCIHLGEDGTAHCPTISQTEMDGNFGYNVWAQSAVNMRTVQIKSKSGTNAHGGGVLRPARHMIFGYKTGGAVNRYLSFFDEFRTKYLVTDPDTAVTCFDWDSDATPAKGAVANHLIFNPLFPAGQQTSSLLKYEATRMDEKITIIEDNRPVRETPEQVISRIEVAQDLPTAVGIIKFEKEEFDPLNLHNAATGEITILNGGNYRVSATISINRGAAGAINLYIYKGAAEINVRRRLTDGTAAESFAIESEDRYAAGDVITIRGDTGGAGAVAIDFGITKNRMSCRKCT